MKNNSWIEYPAYWLLRLFGALVTSFSPRLNFVLGRLLGICGFILLEKKRNLVIKNLKRAFPTRGYEELKNISRQAFINLALNIIEALYIPRINARYINRHIRIENLKYFDEALGAGKGLIFLAYHFGNWELANVTCGLQGYSYKVVVNEQRYPLLNKLLNRYRESKGCKTIPRGLAIRHILKALRDNEIVAMVGDQGGREGRLIDFFGLPVPVPVGAVKFALNLGSSLIPVFIIRERRFYHRIILEEPLKIEETDNPEEDIRKVLAASNRVLERYITKYPQEYFWFYKIWKYSPTRQVVILSDGKPGHLRQAEAVLKAAYNSQLAIHSSIIEARFKNKLTRAIFAFGFFGGIDLSKICLTQESYAALKNIYADLVISAGSSLAGVNLALARENMARSICVMKPGLAKAQRFDLVIVPRHDNPKARQNVLITEGALNLIDEQYVKQEADSLKMRLGSISFGPSLGLLIGGDAKGWRLTKGIMQEVIHGLKNSCESLGKDILVTTSRRTSGEIRDMVKEAFKDYSRCRLFVAANENNIPEAVGGILGLSELVVVSGESISMVSEAAASGRFVVVFRLRPSLRLKTRHEAFLENLQRQGYIYVVDAQHIASKIKDVFTDRPPTRKLNDGQKIQEAVRRLL